jgi:uncharacterized protein
MFSGKAKKRSRQPLKQPGQRLKQWLPGILVFLAGGAVLGTAILGTMLLQPGLLPKTVLANPPQEAPTGPTRPQSLPLSAYTVINQQRIELEVAQTPEQQEIGLMFRPSLAPNRGMLFPFSPPRPVAFWMKNCLISLDMVFIRNERVIAISANVPPCRKDPCPSYGPAARASVDHVLELAGGRAAQLGLKVGDSITITPISSPPANIL